MNRSFLYAFNQCDSKKILKCVQKCLHREANKGVKSSAILPYCMDLKRSV